MIWILVGLIILGIAAFASSMASSNAQARQAQAVIEVAQAAQIAAEGQRQATTAITLLIVLLLVVIAAGLVAVFVLLRQNKRLAHQVQLVPSQRPGGPWLPGPNAQWGRQPQLPAGDPLQALVAMKLLELMGQGQPAQPPQPQGQPPQLPASVDDWRWWQ